MDSSARICVNFGCARIRKIEEEEEHIQVELEDTDYDDYSNNQGNYCTVGRA